MSNTAPESDAAPAPPATASSSDDDEKTSFTISQDLYDALSLKGFSENAIKKSIASGCIDEATCTQWITLHEGHPELDTPLADGVEVVIKAKRILTEAERDAKVQELQERIHERKEQEKREAHQKELHRITTGRRMLETKENMDAVRRELEQEEARRVKHADAEARRRVKIQIIADRYTRQGKPHDEALHLAEQEYEASLQQAREGAEARLQAAFNTDRAAASASATAPVAEWDLGSVLDSSQAVGDRLAALFNSQAPTLADAERLVAGIQGLSNVSLRDQCLQTLRTILANVCEQPLDVKKRTLRTTTATFSKRILPVDEAVALLRICNFDLSTDPEGNHAVVCTTVVLRVIRHIVALLSTA